jgi:GNAT superfamily N-acetyltransferase
VAGTGGFELRDARGEDAAEVARLAGELGYPSDADAMSARLARAAADFRGAVFVAAADARLCGWIEVQLRASIDSPEAAEIVGLVVDATRRRCGVGVALVQRARAWARERGVERMRVRTNVLRAEAPRFYESLGFRESKRQRVYSLDA